MVSLPTGYLNQDVELLRVETETFHLYIKGKPFHPTVEALHLHRGEAQEWVHATFHMFARIQQASIQQAVIFCPHQGELVPWYPGRDTYPIFYETQSYELIIEKKQAVDISFHHENPNLKRAIKPIGRGNLLCGILHFQNEVGYTDLLIQLNGKPALDLKLEIFPTKLDYRKDYQLLLQEVNEQIYNLSFDFLRKTYQNMGSKETSNPSLTEYYAVLQHVFDKLVQAVERMSRSPHFHLQEQERKKIAPKVKRPSKQNLSLLKKYTHTLIEDEHGFIPYEGKNYLSPYLLDRERQISYDTNENSWIRWILERIQTTISELKKRASVLNRKQNTALEDRLHKMMNRIRQLLHKPFLQVSPLQHKSVSLVLQMAPHYREVYSYYLMLTKGLSFQDHLLQLSMKDVAQLYEYWCFLKIHQLLKRKYTLIHHDVIKVHRTGLFVTLDRSQKARFVYQNPINGEEFTLFYNSLPKEDQQVIPTSAQRPDTVLTLRKNESSIVYKYIFDAKYRLNPAYEGSSYWRKYRSAGPEEEDINTMHRYRDAIVSLEEHSDEIERSMFGAYVLFPYAQEEAYKTHHFYKSIALTNVGAIPLLPNATHLLEEFLDEIIKDSPEKAYERSTRPRGTREYYQQRMMHSNVLVGSLRSPSQQNLALAHHFYHVPLSNLADHTLLTQIEYIALCQSKRQFASSGQTGIHWYGRVRSWKVVKRKDIWQISARKGTEEQLYVVFTVESWEIKERPIALGASNGVYTVLYTTKYLFDRATQLAELKLQTEEQLKEWREKRRQGAIHVKLDHEYVDKAQQVTELVNKEE